MNNNLLEQKKYMHLYFNVGEKFYAIDTDNIAEIIQLPLLEYPQKLPNNIVGLLKYNNRVINIADIRFYTNDEVEPYTTQNKVIITKIDGFIFGIIAEKIMGIIPFDAELTNKLPNTDEESVLTSLYKHNGDSVFILNLRALKNILTDEEESYKEFDVKKLFPVDEDSKAVMAKRSKNLMVKSAQTFEVSSILPSDKYISINLGDNYYCISLDYIKEVVKDASVTKVPGTPDFIDGIMSLKGEYVTVINLKKFLDLPDTAVSQTNSAVVIKDKEFQIAFVVDKINELFEFPKKLNYEIAEGYYVGEFIYNDIPYTVLNIDKIVSDRRIIVTDIE